MSLGAPHDYDCHCPRCEARRRSAEELAQSVDATRIILAAPELFKALDELVSAVLDGLRRHAAGDPSAIASNLIDATLRQAEAAIRKAKGE